jgi:hypothetical protein
MENPLRDFQIAETDEVVGEISVSAFSPTFGDRVVVAVVMWDSGAPQEFADAYRAEALDLVNKMIKL